MKHNWKSEGFCLSRCKRCKKFSFEYIHFQPDWCDSDGITEFYNKLNKLHGCKNNKK